MINKKPHTEFLSGARGKIMLCALCVLLYVLLFFLFTACVQNSHDDPDDPGFEEGIPTEVRITLSSRPANAQTRGDGTPKDPTSSVELIHNWWLAIINETSKDVKIIERNDIPPADRTTSTSVNIDNGFEAETFKIILPTGNYHIYAFANIDVMHNFKDSLNQSDLKLKDKYIKSFVPEGFTGNDITDNNEMQWRSDKRIPMTQIIKDLKIKNTVEEAFNIEVVRAVAKVEFAFSNPSKDKIELQELKMSPISKGDNISIIPNNNAVGLGPNDKLYADITKQKKLGELTFTDFNLTDKSDKYNMGKFSFYCKESIPEENGGPFTIELKVKQNGVDLAPRTYFTKKITYINRNDWVLIPITFTDWIIRWRMHYYPPIGGYPPLFEQDNDGTTVNLVATTPGEFEIFPDITYNGENDTRLDYDWVQGGKNTWSHVPNEDDPIEYVKIEVTDGKNLFVKEPTKQMDKGSVGNKDRYYFSGEFNNTEGTATVVVTFKLLDGPYKGEIKTCIFKITRQNSSN